jgi:hypothetical protein
VHCCAAQPPVGLLVAAGARGLSLDATLLTTAQDDAIGEALESGVHLLLGTVPTTDTGAAGDDARPARALGHRLGVPPDRLAERVTVTPTCGLAGATPAFARTALGRATAAARRLVDDPEGEHG